MSSILFITGTDTGVGKTVATVLLLYHLRQTGLRALAMKPFCSGDRADVEVLQALQPGELTDAEMNPYYFPLPLAPLLAARRYHRRIPLLQVLQSIRQVAQKCDRLLIEGCGGLLAPLGEGFSLAQIIAKIGGDTLVVAPNKLGVINHVCLTLKALPMNRCVLTAKNAKDAEQNRQENPSPRPSPRQTGRGRNRLTVLLMDQKTPDLSAKTNPGLLRELLGGEGRRGDAETRRRGDAERGVFELGFLGYKPLAINNLQTNYKKVKKVLAAVAGWAKVTRVRSLGSG